MSRLLTGKWGWGGVNVCRVLHEIGLVGRGVRLDDF